MRLTYNFHVKKGGAWNLNIVVLCIQTSIALHQPTFVDTAFCTWPPALRTQIFVNRCAAMKSECTINVTSFQYKWRLMVRSYFHRCTSADVFRHRSMSPFIAEWCHSEKTCHRWASVGVHRRPMHSDKVWTHHYGAFRLPSFCIGRRLSTLVFCGTTRIMRTNIHNAQSCCERLASADVDRCTAMKSECTIMVRSDFIVVHRKFRLSIVKPSYLGLA